MNLGNPINLKDRVERLEKKFIKLALELTKGNKAHAAELLTINRTTLVEKCRRYGFPLNQSTRRVPHRRPLRNIDASQVSQESR